jgi:hypothetical protein
VDLCGVAEVSAPERFGLLLEVLLDERDLILVRRVIGDDGLQAAFRVRHEVVGRGVQVEGHDLGAAFGDDGLSVGAAEPPRVGPDKGHCCHSRKHCNARDERTSAAGDGR